MELATNSSGIIATFDSAEEMMRAALNPLPEYEEKARRWTNETHSFDWHGLADVRANGTLKDCVDILSGGWGEGARKLSGLIDATDAPMSKTRRRRRVWGDDGDEVCPDRLRAGQFETAFCRMRSAEARGPSAVRIHVDAIGWSYEESDAMFWRGAAAVALADCLIKAGYSVKLVSSWTGDQGRAGTRTIVHCVTKEYQSPFDITTAAATMACPGFFRFIGHAWGFGHFSEKYVTNIGYYPKKITMSELPEASGEIVLLSGQNIKNQGDSMQWIKDQAKMIQPEGEA